MKKGNNCIYNDWQNIYGIKTCYCKNKNILNYEEECIEMVKFGKRKCKYKKIKKIKEI